MFIMPTQTCFDDAFEIVLQLLDNNVPPKAVRIVHGICQLPSGKLYAHAWVEYANRCFQLGVRHTERIALAEERRSFYANVRMQSCTRYTLESAAKFSRAQQTTGPWIPAYKALCASVQ